MNGFTDRLPGTISHCGQVVTSEEVSQPRRRNLADASVLPEAPATGAERASATADTGSCEGYPEGPPLYSQRNLDWLQDPPSMTREYREAALAKRAVVEDEHAGPRCTSMRPRVVLVRNAARPPSWWRTCRNSASSRARDRDPWRYRVLGQGQLTAAWIPGRARR